MVGVLPWIIDKLETGGEQRLLCRRGILDEKVNVRETTCAGRVAGRNLRALEYEHRAVPCRSRLCQDRGREPLSDARSPFLLLKRGRDRAPEGSSAPRQKRPQLVSRGAGDRRPIE
jgi:hypothetical protein